MKTWLHYVGRQYYSEREFVREARRYGVTRRVSLAQLRRMDFGDRILLAIRDGASSVVFGYFHLETITGLSPEASAACDDLKGHTIDLGGALVKRKCGRYTTGATVAVSCSLATIAERLEGVDNPGKLMIGGEFVAYERIRMKKIPHQQGYRLFDYASWCEDVAIARRLGGGLPTLSGFYYAKPDDFEPVDALGLLQEVQGYTRA